MPSAVGEPARVQRPAAAERDQHAAPRVDAALHAHAPQRARHRRVGGGDDRLGRRLDAMRRGARPAPSTAAIAPRGVELDAVAHSRRRDVAQRNVRVGDGGLRATAAEGDRARPRARAARARRAARRRRRPSRCCRRRPTPSPRARAAARSARRRPTPPASTSGSPSSTRPTSALVPPMSMVSALSMPNAARDERRAGHAAGRTRERERRRRSAPHRQPGRVPPLDDITLGAGSPARLQPSTPAAHVSPDARPHVRLAHRRRGALVLADLRQHVGRAARRRRPAAGRARRCAAQRRARARASRSAYACSSDTATTSGASAATCVGDVRGDGVVVERASDRLRARCAPAPPRRDPAATSGARMVRGQVVERRAVLAAQLEQVGGAGGGAQHDARAACARAACSSPRSCRARRARRRRAGSAGGAARRSTPSLWSAGVLETLHGDHRAVVGDGGEVGERAADVDADRETAHAADRETAARPTAAAGRAGTVPGDECSHGPRQRQVRRQRQRDDGEFT